MQGQPERFTIWSDVTRLVKENNNISRQRYEAAMQVMGQLEREPAHVIQVSKLALQLFDQLLPLHRLQADDRDMLEAAALLHDIGYVYGSKGHNKKSLQMIVESDLAGWDDQQLLMIGNIARYHNNAVPKQKHSFFSVLPEPCQDKVKKLAALLRLADGLDRSHSDAISSITCRIGAKSVKIDLETRGKIVHELHGFKKKRDLFSIVFEKKIKIGRIIDRWHIQSRHFAVE